MRIACSGARARARARDGDRARARVRARAGVVVACGEDEDRLRRARQYSDRVRDGVRARCRRIACIEHSSTQSARIAMVARAEVRQMRWPYLPRAR